jgi:two-component system, response regulator PdtaR
MELAAHSQSLVLIVEDEALIRMSAIDMVEQTGRGIVEAVDADDAIRVLASREDIGFLFTDVEMPGSMDGYKLARTVHARWPDIAIVITSGRKEPGIGDVPAGGRFISKPYEAVVVAQALSEFVNPSDVAN